MWPFSKRKTDESKLPSITFQITPEGKILISADWTKTEGEAAFQNIVRRMTGMIILICEGQLEPVIKHAISEASFKIDDQKVAKSILLSLEHEGNNLKNIQGASASHEDAPLICPTEAFGLRYTEEENEN